MNKNGIRVTYVDSDNFTDAVKDDEFTFNNIFSKILDPVRYFSRNFWVKNNNSFIKSSGPSIFSIKHLQNDSYILTCDRSIFFKDTFENGILRKKYDPIAWEEYITSITPPENQIFEDFYFDFLNPLDYKTLDSNTEASLAFFNREFKYNFYSPKFENLISDPMFNTFMLPSVWDILNDGMVDQRTMSENLILSLGGFIDSNYVDRLFLPNVNKNAIKEYFDKYADIYSDPNIITVGREISIQQTRLPINKNKINLLNKIDGNKIPFPFYMSLNFSNLSDSPNSFINSIGSLSNDLSIFALNFDDSAIQTKKFINSSALYETKIKYFNLLDWINYETSNFKKIEQKALEFTSNTPLTSEKALKYTDLINYINKNIKVTKRNYLDFINKPAHWEVLFYKVEKRRFNFNSELEQSFYIEPDQSKLINFIDTQIRYGTEYFYTIKAVTLVVGNSYMYKKYDYKDKNIERKRDIEAGQYKINIINKPSYKVYELEYAKFSGAVYETPQTRPVISIKNDNSVLAIKLEHQAQESLEQFNIIEGSDFKQYEAIAKSQDNIDGKIHSALNEDMPVTLQIYKTTSKPVSYMSFEGKLYKTITLDAGVESFEDRILSSQKYYYLVRRLNIHGIPSNTSDIYEVEYVEEGDLTFLRTEKISLEGEKKRVDSKPMKKYLLIKPSILQDRPVFSDTPASIYDVNFGTKIDPVWNKKFVLKIKSKKTNRELTFNISSIINKKIN